MEYVLKCKPSSWPDPYYYANDSAVTRAIENATRFKDEHAADRTRHNLGGLWRRYAQIVPVRTVVVTTTKVEEVPE